MKKANSFGYEKEVSLPPSCLVSIFADKSTEGCVKRLNYPVPLKGAIVGDDDRDPKLFFIRILEGINIILVLYIYMCICSC